MIITSLLDNDLYKLSMMQLVFHQFPDVHVEYQYKCRSSDIDLRPYIDEIKREILSFCELVFKNEELDYLSSLNFIQQDFIDFLSSFQLSKKSITLFEDDISKNLGIKIIGPWLDTILLEVPILSIVNEIYFKEKNNDKNLKEGRERLDSKIKLILEKSEFKEFKLIEYGTRRRYSKSWHSEVIKTLKKTISKNFLGTSNIFFAKQYQLKPLGTMGHEYLQACQVLAPTIKNSQKFAFKKWIKEYPNSLKIALSDIYGLEPFLSDFDLNFCRLFDGVRHDSGDPFLWGEKIIKHYEKNGIDPRTKTLIFSDCLTVPLALDLFEYFSKRCKVFFGIGTNLTNDLGYKPLQNVIKMVRCNNRAVAKLSDTPEKTICEDPIYLSYLKKVFNIN